MSIQSSILSLIHTTAAGLKVSEFVKSKKTEEPKAIKEKQAPKVATQETPSGSPVQKDEPIKEQREPVYFKGGGRVSPELEEIIYKALEKKNAAEASMVVAQEQKRAKRVTKNDPARDLMQFKHLGMGAML